MILLLYLNSDITRFTKDYVCQIVLDDQGFVVLFFFKLTLLKYFKKTHRISEFFPISAKVMPWSLWKWLCPQCIFEGKHFPNSIGYSPGKAQVTNIDLKCSFFTGLSKSRVPIFFQLCLGFPWGWILKSTLIAPALKENIFQKVGHHITKFISPNTIAKTSQKVCRSDCVVWSMFCGSLTFFKLTLLKYFKKTHRISDFFPSVPRSCLGLCENDCAPSAFLKENISQTQSVIAQGKHRLQTLI